MESKYRFAIDFSRFLAFGHWALGFGVATAICRENFPWTPLMTAGTVLFFPQEPANVHPPLVSNLFWLKPAPRPAVSLAFHLP